MKRNLGDTRGLLIFLFNWFELHPKIMNFILKIGFNVLNFNI